VAVPEVVLMVSVAFTSGKSHHANRKSHLPSHARAFPA